MPHEEHLLLPGIIILPQFGQKSILSPIKNEYHLLLIYVNTCLKNLPRKNYNKLNITPLTHLIIQICGDMQNYNLNTFSLNSFEIDNRGSSFRLNLTLKSFISY